MSKKQLHTLNTGIALVKVVLLSRISSLIFVLSSSLNFFFFFKSKWERESVSEISIFYLSWLGKVFFLSAQKVTRIEWNINDSENV